MNASIKVLNLIEQLTASLGNSAAVDLFYYWLEEQYRFVRERPWVWNWTDTSRLTEAGKAETTTPTTTFTWTEGDDFILVSPALSLDYTLTGRKVMLGDEWYRVVDYGLTNSLRIYMDRAIRGSQATGTALTFYRDDFGVHTCKIRKVDIDLRKAPRASLAFLDRLFSDNRARSAGNPGYYTDDDSFEIPAPLYAPTLANGAVGTLANGRYEYFYTRYDTESRMESAPGPVASLEHTGGLGITAAYGNPAGDKSDYTTYQLRLWRSMVNPSRERPPMFLNQSRSPVVPGATYNDVVSDATIRGRERYYDGARTVIRLWPIPDSTRRSVVVKHVRTWGGRPFDDEYLDLGRNNEILELLRIFLKGVVDLKSGDAASHRAASAVFRSQLAYLLTLSREAAEGDEGPETYYPPIAGNNGPSLSGDWVDFLPWKD